MTEREKRDFNYNDMNNSHGKYGASNAGSTLKPPPAGSGMLAPPPGPTHHHPHPLPMVPVPAKSTGSLLSLWQAREKSKASNGHVEFAGRSYGGEMKTELYPQIRLVISVNYNDVLMHMS